MELLDGVGNIRLGRHRAEQARTHLPEQVGPFDSRAPQQLAAGGGCGGSSRASGLHCLSQIVQCVIIPGNSGSLADTVFRPPPGLDKPPLHQAAYRQRRWALGGAERQLGQAPQGIVGVATVLEGPDGGVAKLSRDLLHN
jgi:hypothetical protein